MKRIVLPFVVALAVSGTTVLGADTKANYESYCTKCHGADGKGDTKMGKRTGAKDYSDPKVQAELKDEAAFKAIKDGSKIKMEKC
jgi:hypothetical protein